MKKYISFVFVFLAAVALGAPAVQAEEAAVTTSAEVNVSTTVKPTLLKVRPEALKAKADARAESMKAKVEAKREEVKEKKEAREEISAEKKAAMEARAKIIKAERKAKLDEAKKKRVDNAARVSVKVLTDAIGRVSELNARVTARVEAAEAKGANVAEPEARLVEADALIATAQAKVAALDADLKAALESETPIASFEAFRTHAGEAKDAIKEAHAKVVEAIASLKAAAPAPAASTEVQATTTVEVNQ